MNKVSICLVVFFCFAAPCGFGQDESLLIGPGDLLNVQVLEAPEMNQHARVTDSGSVPLIIGGEVKVAGLSPAEAADRVAKALVDGRFMLHPHVSVAIEQYATQNVTVMGQVKLPGTYPIATPRPIISVLALAGGVTNLANRRIEIERHVSKKRISYFLSNDSDTALDKNLTVYPGDTVLVPKIDVVYVLGDVERPGGYPMDTNDGSLSLLQVVGLAGSQLPHAKENSTRLIRKQPNGTYMEMQIALSKMEKGKEADIALKPDDIVYVPFSYIKNMGTNLSGIIAGAGNAAILHY